MPHAISRALAAAGAFLIGLAGASTQALAQTSFGASFEVIEDVTWIGGLSGTGRYLVYEAELPGGFAAVRRDLVVGDVLELGIGLPLDITADGTGVIGATGRINGAFLWTEAGGYVDLNDSVFEFRGRTTVSPSLSDDATVLVGDPTTRSAFLYLTGGGPPGGVGGGTSVLLENEGEPWRISGDGRFVVGSSNLGSGFFSAVRWNSTGAIEELRPRAVGRAISADGAIIAGEDLSRNQGFRQWRLRPPVFLAFLPGGTSQSVTGMSADGERIIGSQRVDGSSVACVWDSTGAAQSMLDVLLDAGLDVAAYEFLDAAQISDDGRSFVLRGFDPDGESVTVVARLGGLCAADVDGDGELTTFDLLALIDLLEDGDPRADADGNGRLDVFDLLAFINDFVAGC